MKDGEWLNVSAEELRALQEYLLREFVVEPAADVDSDRRLESGEFLRGETFVFAAWAPPPPEWVSVTRHDDGTISAVSMRHAPGPPSWSENEPPAWDHDHCALCMRDLSDVPFSGDDLSGWRTGENWGSFTWVCAQCFTDFESPLDWSRRHDG